MSLKNSYEKLDRETMTTITVTPDVACIVRSYTNRHGFPSMSAALRHKFRDEELHENSFGLWGRNKRQNYKGANNEQ